MKKFSKLMAAVLALVLCLSLLPATAFAAKEHKHTYTGAGDGHWCIDPACSEYFKKVPHVFEATNIHEPGYIPGDNTHTERCKECGALRNEGHVYTGATCTTPGVCKCGKVDPEGKLNPNNHTGGTEVRDAVTATCETAGYTGDTYCLGCGAKIADGTVIPATGHNFTGGYVQKNTGTGGLGHAQMCVNEGCTATSTTTPCTFGDWTTTKQATCEEDGSKTRTCTVCGREQTETIPATGHKDENGDGNCDDCHNPICVHDWKKTDTVAATCTTAGYDEFTCNKCEKVKREITTLALQHDFQDTDATVNTATCEAGGEKTQYCSRCGATQTVETDPLGHQYGDFIAEVPATCVEDGMQGHYECNRCHKLFTTGTQDYSAEDLKIDALGHTPGDPARENVVAATETTGGSYDEVVRCTVCNEVISSVHHTTRATGTVIEEPDVPLGGDTEIDEPEVPLAGLMTRAEFVNYLYVRADSPAAGLPTFDDVAEDYEYAQAIGWAQANGIAKGVGNNEFAPDELVTVEQALLFLERYAEFTGIEMPVLDALTGKERGEILDNADEVLAEFFGEEYVTAEDEAA